MCCIQKGQTVNKQRHCLLSSDPYASFINNCVWLCIVRIIQHHPSLFMKTQRQNIVGLRRVLGRLARPSVGSQTALETVLQLLWFCALPVTDQSICSLLACRNIQGLGHISCNSSKGILDLEYDRDWKNSLNLFITLRIASYIIICA